MKVNYWCNDINNRILYTLINYWCNDINNRILYTLINYHDYCMFFPPAVGIALPWATNTLIPQGSTVTVNCTASSKHNSLYWTIILPDRVNVEATFTANEFIRTTLNRRGFYEMPAVNHTFETTIRLYINSTAGNNGSMLRCLNGFDVVQETTIIVYGKYNPIRLTLTLCLGYRQWYPTLSTYTVRNFT